MNTYMVMGVYDKYWDLPLEYKPVVVCKSEVKAKDITEKLNAISKEIKILYSEYNQDLIKLKHFESNEEKLKARNQLIDKYLEKLDKLPKFSFFSFYEVKVVPNGKILFIFNDTSDFYVTTIELLE